MRLTRPQLDFLVHWNDIQRIWRAAGSRIGCNPEDGRQRLSLAALQRKGAVDKNGEITETGRLALARRHLLDA